jgi:hypothetical protein
LRRRQASFKKPPVRLVATEKDGAFLKKSYQYKTHISSPDFPLSSLFVGKSGANTTTLSRSLIANANDE